MGRIQKSNGGIAMAFIQSCFVRKNTPELREKSVELGRKLLFSAKHGYGNGLFAMKGEQGFVQTYDGLSSGERIIDCGTDEEMFLALAALRDDTDRDQWFICKEEYISTHTMDLVRTGTWQLNTQSDRLSYGLRRLWRKATAKEIVEHFKEKQL